MSEPVLTFLKFCLVALLYLFLLCVVVVVARELRGTPAPASVAPAAPAPARSARRTRGWRLVLLEPAAESGHAFEIDGEATIGRGGGCAVPIAFDTFASQVHARVMERDGQLWLEDLQSRNGTFLNGARVPEPTRLSKGDRIQIGETVFEARSTR